jgi:hypothetical protein
MMMGLFQRVCNDYNCYLVAVHAGDTEAAAKWARYMHLCWPKKLLDGLPLPLPEQVGLRPVVRPAIAE